MFYLYFLADGGIKQYNNGRNLHTVREDSSYGLQFSFALMVFVHLITYTGGKFFMILFF